jgi:predicted nucleic acid-binding protein
MIVNDQRYEANSCEKLYQSVYPNNNQTNYALSYADVFIVVLAKREGAIVLTCDSEFQALDDSINIEWLLK